MGQTAVINPRKKGKRGGKKRKSPRKYGAAKRRRRSPQRRRPRRRNPAAPTSPYSAGGYRQRPNPNGLMLFNEAVEIIPAGCLGIGASRWAVKQAGEFVTVPGIAEPAPDFKHAFAIYLAATFGADLIGNILGSKAKAQIAKIAAFSWGGDLFVRKRFFADNAWMRENLYMGAMVETSALGEEFVDAAGNRYVKTPQGWQLAGGFGQENEDEIIIPDEAEAGDVIQTEEGEFYQVMDGMGLGQDEFELEPLTEAEAAQMMGRMVETSPLGRRLRADSQVTVPSFESSFGYAVVPNAA